MPKVKLEVIIDIPAMDIATLQKEIERTSTYKGNITTETLQNYGVMASIGIARMFGPDTVTKVDAKWIVT